MSDLEALSELLSGDLPRDQAQALRARIRDEPELAQAWEELRALTADLGELPDRQAPPAHLDAAVLDELEPPSRASLASGSSAARSGISRRRWLLPSLAAAALLAVGLASGLALAPSDAPAVVTLAQGRHRVSGEAVEVRLDAARVQVRGDAWITVEPGSEGVRREGQEDAMDVSHALSAAGGAVVTVAVVSGVALVWPADAPEAAPVTVPAGGSHQVGEMPAEPGVRRDAEPDGQPDPRPSAATRLDPEVAAWVDGLEQDNARLRFENQLLQGQLAVVNGEPAPWPSDLSPSLRPDAFPAHAADAVDRVGGLELVQEDCQEYPCLAVVRVADPSDEAAAREALSQLGEALGQALGGDVNTFMSVARSEEDGQEPRMHAVVGVLPGQEGERPPESVTERMRQRAMGLEGELER